MLPKVTRVENLTHKEIEFWQHWLCKGQDNSPRKVFKFNCAIRRFNSAIFISGKYDDAKKVLQDATQRIIGSVSASEQFCQSLLADLTSASDTMKSSQTYKSHGAHYMMSK